MRKTNRLWARDNRNRARFSAEIEFSISENAFSGMAIPSYPVCTICTSDRESQPGGVQVPGSSDSTVADRPPTGCETIVFYAETAILQIESKEFLHVPRRRSPSRRHDARPLARRERRARCGRAAGARNPDRRLAEHAVPGAARRRADGAADAR